MGEVIIYVGHVERTYVVTCGDYPMQKTRLFVGLIVDIHIEMASLSKRWMILSICKPQFTSIAEGFSWNFV